MIKTNVYWFTGLSGSGKTTITIKLKEKLEKSNYLVKIIDGDEFRTKQHRKLGFNEQDIKTNNRMIAGLCIDSLGKFDVILVPIISPYAQSRIDARERIGDSFNEIYIEAKLETVVRRDTKGLYQKAKNGELDNMIGYSSDSVYEKPLNPDLIVNTETINVSASVEYLYQFIIEQFSVQWAENAVNNYSKRLIKKLGFHSMGILKNPVYYKKRLDYNFERFLADRKAKTGYYSYPHNIIFLAGMSLGGSTWMKNLLARIPGYYTRHSPMPWEVAYKQNFCDSGFNHTPANGYSLFKTHLNPTVENLNCLNCNGVTKILVTYRDYRDVALSLVHRLMKFPKEKNAFDYVDYQEMGFDKALEHSINWICNDNIDWLEGWFELAKQEPERYHFVRFEDLKVDTEKVYRGVLDFYGIVLSDRLIKENVQASIGKGSVEKNFAEARVLPWGLSSNFRSGKIGGWRKEFKPHHIELCKEKLGSALIKVGYEKDLDWEL